MSESSLDRSRHCPAVRRLMPAMVMLAVLFLLASCATAPQQIACPAGTQQLPDCPPLGAIKDDEIDRIYDDRSWLPSKEIQQDLVELGKQASIPIQHAQAKFLGPTDRAAIDSLAVKLWMIENADHTIDFTYYIFKEDLVGYAMIGALCQAVRRGVDIRVIVDSLGSISGMTQPALKALVTCADDAGFMRNAKGELTTRKARIQVIAFNAISKIGRPNRRSHDKLLIKDGSFDSKFAVITGGRNISTDYYAITEEGLPDTDAFRDAEILIRSSETVSLDEITVGELSEAYNSILFLLDFNKRIQPLSNREAINIYARERGKAYASLSLLKNSAYFKPHLMEMDRYMTSGFHDSQVRFAHELGNLSDRDVVTDAEGNQARNPNSIMEVLSRIAEEGPEQKTVRIVSPYLFLAEYKSKDGRTVNDEAEEFRAWLEARPGTTLEIVTNSVLTSDNFPAQSVIDMETAPRLLLPPDVREQWLALNGAEEHASALVNSERWKELVNHPRLKVYETGRLDSVKLGGDAHYGKLHAKFFLADDFGFVGTTNFDYRSRLYNNEMGFFFADPGLAADVQAGFDELVESSYLWGSPEWFELRKAVMEMGGMKGSSTQGQRGWYKLFKNTGIIWLL